LFISGALGGLAGYLGLLTTTLAAIARGRVSRDGQWIVLRRPAPAFAAAAQAALEHASSSWPSWPSPVKDLSNVDAALSPSGVHFGPELSLADRSVPIVR
jgi:hypothetical protein